MSTQKRQNYSCVKGVVFAGVCVVAFSVAWMLDTARENPEHSNLTSLIRSAHASDRQLQASAEQAGNTGAGYHSDRTSIAATDQEKVGKRLPEEMAAQVLSPIKRVRPDLPIDDLDFSPMEGVYKATLQDKALFFDASGQFFIVGEMYEVTNQQLVNLQAAEQRALEAALAPQRAKLLAGVAKEDMVIFPATGDARTYVYVFTDIDCGFCRKLHRQMPEMQARGIEVRYLGFPRAGIHSNSAQKLVTTWCAAKPKEIMTQFKQGKTLALKPCEPNPVADHYALGQAIGVRGTPAIVLASGQMVPGAVSTQELVEILTEANLY